jgi:hypothetical protein
MAAIEAAIAATTESAPKSYTGDPPKSVRHKKPPKQPTPQQESKPAILSSATYKTDTPKPQPTLPKAAARALPDSQPENQPQMAEEEL